MTENSFICLKLKIFLFASQNYFWSHYGKEIFYVLDQIFFRCDRTLRNKKKKHQNDGFISSLIFVEQFYITEDYYNGEEETGCKDTIKHGIVLMV